MDSDLQARLERQAAFWRAENHGRPLLGFTGTYFSVELMQVITRSQGRVTPGDIAIDRLLEVCDRQWEIWRDATGDLIWTANPLYQFRWLAAAAGAPVFAGRDSVWAEPFVHDYQVLDGLRVSEENPWVRKLWQLTDALLAHATGRFPVAANEFLSPLSALADLRGNTQLAFDLYDRPDEVQYGLDRLTGFWGALVSAQYQRIPPWHGGYASAQRYIWAPGRIIEFSEDPAFMFSPRFHQQFVLPSHRAILSMVDYPYIHLHSSQLHTLDRLLEMDNLPAIELTPDIGASISDLVPTIAKIQVRKPVIVHAFFTAEEMRMIRDAVPPEGLCIISRAETPDAARRLRDALS